ncbi:MAG: RNA polymerase sigma factor [Candidatus Buchananbacteria bacterium]
MQPSNISDNLLLLRLKKKDPEAFAKLYDLYVTPIYRFIYFKVSSQQDAEDLTSEVFMKVWQYVTETEDVIENFRALIYKVARNSVIDFYRARAKSDMPQSDEILSNIVDDHQQSLLRQIEIEIDVNKIESVLKKVKDEYRDVIILKYIDGLSTKEIAKILDKSNGSVRVLLHRALGVIREIINQNGKQ